jgi:hypothetical protein
MAKLQSGTVVYGNLTVNTFANIAGNLILGAQLYAGGSYGTNGQILQNVGGTGVAWANPSSGSTIFNGTSNVAVLSTGGNVVVSVGGAIIANVGSTGLTVIGGISAGTFTGNGAGLTGLPAGYSNVQVATYLPSYSGTVGASFVNSTGNVLAAAGVFNAIGVNGGAITSTGYINTSANISAALYVGGAVNVSGNILSTGAILNSLTVNGSVAVGSANTAVRSLTVGGGEMSIIGQAGATPTAFLNIHDYAGNYGNAATFYIRGLTATGSASARINVFDVEAVQSQFAGNVIPTVTNAYTLGTPSFVWSTIYGKATSAQYADLAEVYTSDKKYVAGTVVVFGGNFEVTISTQTHDPRIAGVISTNPAYLMNSTETGVQVALTGRVPCRVQGPVSKGDRLVASDLMGVATRLDLTLYEPGCIIGKALEDITDDRVHTIEVVVGRL